MSARTYTLIEQYRNALDTLHLFSEQDSYESKLAATKVESEMSDAANQLVELAAEVTGCVAFGDLKGMEVYGTIKEFRNDLVFLSVQGELIECTVASLTSAALLVAC